MIVREPLKSSQSYEINNLLMLGGKKRLLYLNKAAAGSIKGLIQLSCIKAAELTRLYLFCCRYNSKEIFQISTYFGVTVHIFLLAYTLLSEKISKKYCGNGLEVLGKVVFWNRNGVSGKFYAFSCEFLCPVIPSTASPRSTPKKTICEYLVQCAILKFFRSRS